MREYETIPTLAKWQSDSSVMMATRLSDTILSQIDALIGVFHEARGGFRRPIALDLYFSIDYWLKFYKMPLAFVRSQAATLTRRLRETRRFIQAVTGPRQVGKTTLVRQVIEAHRLKAEALGRFG